MKTAKQIARVLAGLCLAASAVSASSFAADTRPVKVTGGLIRGVADHGLRIYEGIPFAAPPVGDLRWRPPQPVKPWRGVKQTTAFAPECMQNQARNASLGLPIMPISEDCLYVNVWTPAQAAKSAKAHLPVMIWIYGGGFWAGGASLPMYDGAALARRGVVVVSIAYRLNAFGFLAHPELSAEAPDHASGLYGIQDMIAALKWTKANAAAFGGDPKDVTIFGQSAGGFAVSILAASPEAKGLFERVISESGGRFSPAKSGDEGGSGSVTLEAGEAHGQAYLSKMHVDTIAEARKLPAEVLMAEAAAEQGTFQPVQGGRIMPEDAWVAYQHGRFNDVPVLIGFNSDEGAYSVKTTTAAEHEDYIRKGFGEKADALLKVYPNGPDGLTLHSARNIRRDTNFGWQTWAWARQQSAHGKGKVFMYYTTHRPPGTPDGQGATHGTELPYVFGHPAKTWTAEDTALSDTLQGYWVNFARTGDPNGPGLPVWPAYSDAAPQVMALDTPPHPAPVPNMEQLKALDDYYAWRRGQQAGGAG